MGRYGNPDSKPNKVYYRLGSKHGPRVSRPPTVQGDRRAAKSAALRVAMEDQISFAARYTGRPALPPTPNLVPGQPKPAILRVLDESPEAYKKSKPLDIGPRKRDGSSRLRPFKDTLPERPAKKPGENIWAYEIRAYRKHQKRLERKRKNA